MQLQTEFKAVKCIMESIFFFKQGPSRSIWLQTFERRNAHLFKSRQNKQTREQGVGEVLYAVINEMCGLKGPRGSIISLSTPRQNTHTHTLACPVHITVYAHYDNYCNMVTG